MSGEYEYLSEKALELLITEVEQRELVAAPPDMRQSIVNRIYAEEKRAEADRRQNTAKIQREFYQYCFRVAVSVAAAVMLVFVLPGPQRESTWKKIRSEELQWDEGIFTDLLNGTSIFNGEDKFEIFQ